MSEAATREDIDEVIGIMKNFMNQSSQEFVSIPQEFAKVHRRLAGLDQKYDRLITTIDGFVARIDRYETELAARDSQFERLLT